MSNHEHYQSIENIGFEGQEYPVTTFSEDIQYTVGVLNEMFRQRHDRAHEREDFNRRMDIEELKINMAVDTLFALLRRDVEKHFEENTILPTTAE